MHVVTFYSFKGGVGRTLALVNVGLQLVKTGRRVLLVDFDLEAPGINTFDLLKPREPNVGMVEYVSDFVTTHSAPDVNDFIYEVLGVGQKGGRLWVMPAGKGDESYSRKLSDINWQKLYDEFHGFLMFEDLKAQWEASFKPDYVLIDSRTGYTDIGGICTRQLPDAVVVLFFPNEQNLAGLKPIVSSISNEKTRAKKEPIQLHYVMSNVPDLDDEQEILSNFVQRFKEQLKFEDLPLVIHRYDSLLLLNQAPFVIERPKSRLAKEYKQLTEIITEQNIEDREAVVQRLTKRPSFRMQARFANLPKQDQVKKILRYHAHDGEVLYLLAMDLKLRGYGDESESLLKRSIELGYRSPQALLAQAEVKLQGKGPTAIVSDVFEAFQNSDLDEDELTRGIQIIRQVAPEKLLEITHSPAFNSLEDSSVLLVADELMSCKEEGLQAACDLLSRHYKRADINVRLQEEIQGSLSLALIGLSRFEEAMKLFGRVRPAPQDLDMATCFNYGMAEWGATDTPPKDMFERVIFLNREDDEIDDPNFNQCLAIAFWVIGNKQNAIGALEEAKEQIVEKPTAEFSCWRYMKVSPSDFQEDCESILKLINGENIRPMFFPK